MGVLPNTLALFTSLTGSFVQSMQLPGLRLPTLEECMEENCARDGERIAEEIRGLATAGGASSQVAPDASSQAAEASVLAPKMRRIRGETLAAFC